MAQLNVEKITLSSKDREKEEQKRIHRRKTLLILIHHYLKEYGYIQAADVLNSEVNFNLGEHAVCDNIHLESIIQDYESYYFIKYQKHPQIIKKLPKDLQHQTISGKPRSNRFPKNSKISNLNRNYLVDQVGKGLEKDVYSAFQGANDLIETPSNKNYGEPSKWILEPLGSFENYSSEWKTMAELILQDMHTANNSVRWDDVIGHDKAKELLKEAIVYPMKYQELYSSVSPWRSMLLYGPSGTGKTLLASTAASESGATFFKLCISTLISKWRGESEKLIKVLFDLAKHYAPSIIFIDEIDALISHRGDDHEASRRMKTELFLQLDSLFATDKLVLVLSATNMPWQLDYAMLRRLEKRVLISHPYEESREHLFQKFLPHSVGIIENFKMKMDLDYIKLAKVTKNYSAADIETVCKEGKMNYVRQTIKAVEQKSVGAKFSKVVMQPLNTEVILLIIDKIKPTASELLSKYEEWKQKHGSE